MSFTAPASRRVKGTGFTVGIVAARYNEELADALLERTAAALRVAGVKPAGIPVVRVPGSHEVPWAVQALLRRHRPDVVIALGVLVGGDTNHHEMVGAAVAHALQAIVIATGVPVINGVIVADTRAQAAARTRGRINRGAEFAAAALEMGALRRSLRAGPPSR
jgi:6,7-dimethyl-8-ribityllumazine synthase